jgi:hypothetical protein
LSQHLVIWEMWSQLQAPERSAESFISAWKTRLRIENEIPDAFPNAVSKRIQSMGLTAKWIRLLRAMVHQPARIAWAVSVLLVGLVGVFLLAAPRRASAVTTIQGEAVCTACVLHENHEHMQAIRVAHGAANEIYYLDRTPEVAAQQVHFCMGPTLAIVKGKARTDHGRRLFEATSITFTETNKPGAPPNFQR